MVHFIKDVIKLASVLVKTILLGTNAIDAQGIITDFQIVQPVVAVTYKDTHNALAENVSAKGVL